MHLLFSIELHKAVPPLAFPTIPMHPPCVGALQIKIKNGQKLYPNLGPLSKGIATFLAIQNQIKVNYIYSKQFYINT